MIGGTPGIRGKRAVRAHATPRPSARRATRSRARNVDRASGIRSRTRVNRPATQRRTDRRGPERSPGQRGGLAAAASLTPLRQWSRGAAPDGPTVGATGDRHVAAASPSPPEAILAPQMPAALVETAARRQRKPGCGMGFLSGDASPPAPSRRPAASLAALVNPDMRAPELPLRRFPRRLAEYVFRRDVDRVLADQSVFAVEPPLRILQQPGEEEHVGR
jgi:hypothetical protein